MADGIDTGNPNVFTTFKGRYLLDDSYGYTVDNPYVMLSCTNDVQLLGDWVLQDYLPDVAFALLPSECRPAKTVKVPVAVETQDDVKMEILTIDPDGSMSLPIDVSYAMVYLSGVSFHISLRWY